MRCFTVPLADADLHVEAQGDTPKTVFLHGMGGDTHTWDLLWQALGEAFPALRYDLRGFGLSHERGERPFDHADDLLVLLDATQTGPCNLVGVSMGGSIALNFALGHPEKVSKLILISPALVAWEWSEQWRPLWRQIAACAKAGAMDEARQLWWRHPLFATTRDGPSGPILYDSIMRYAGKQWCGDHHKSMLPDVDRLHALEVPTVLLTGERDLPDFRLIADLIAASSGQVQRIDYPARGHMLHLEVPEDCARAIKAFLASPAPLRYSQSVRQ